jgi:hypothetical protein
VGNAGEVVDRRVLDALLPMLDDRSSTGASSGFDIRWADASAAAIAAMLGLELTPEARDPDAAARDRAVESVRAAVRASLDSIDWAELRRKAQERRDR